MHACCSYARGPFCPSAVYRCLCSKIVEPFMREGFGGREPFPRVKVCQASDEILEVRVKGLHVPSDERFTRILIVKSVPKRFQHLAPRAVAEVPQQPIETFQVRKVRNLAFKYMGQG